MAHAASAEHPTSVLSLHRNTSLQPPGLLSSNSEGPGAHVARNSREGEGLNGKARSHRWNDTSLDRQRDTENGHPKARIRPWADAAADPRTSSLVHKKKKADNSKAPPAGGDETTDQRPASAAASRDAPEPRTATLDRIRSAMGGGGTTDIHKAASKRSITPPPMRHRSPQPQQSSVSPRTSLTPMRASLNKAKAARLGTGVAMSASPPPSLASHTATKGPQETAHSHRSLPLLTVHTARTTLRQSKSMLLLDYFAHACR